MKKHLRNQQHDLTDCGAACLASVAASYGRHIPLARIRQYASTDKQGTNVLGMVEAATQLGFACKAVRGGADCLSQIPLPSIAHLEVRDLHHFVVFYRFKKNRITLMDPEDGRFHTLSKETFLEQWTGVLLLLQPRDGFEQTLRTASPLYRFLHLLRPHRSLLLEALWGAALYSLLGLSTSIYVEKVVDNVLGDGNLNLLHLLSLVMLVLLIARTYIGGAKSLIALRTGQKLDASLILGYYRHLLNLPQTFFDTMRIGEIVSRVNDAVKIRLFINNVALDLTVNLLMLVFSLLLMCVYSWKLAVVTMGCIPMFGLLYWISDRFNRKYARQIMERSADLETQLVESIESIGTIKRFGLEAHTQERTENRFYRLLERTYRLGNAGIWIGSFAQLISGGVTLALFWIGGRLVLQHELTAGTLLSFYALINYILTPILALIGANQSIQDALIAADRLFQILDLEQEASGRESLSLTAPHVGDIQFTNVTFRYGSRRRVFEHFNLTVEKGKTTAIIGESGSGKSTLMALLQNIYPIQEGHIYFGGYDLRQVRNDSLRRLVGTVPQDIQLFAGSILENIALGEYRPDSRRVVELCHSLGIKDFIEQLPQGYETRLGEHGLSLSGGERQRIAIARALYRDPEILIFDEATSSLDAIAEHYVKETLRSFAQRGKTVLLIAHRLSTIQDADRIVVLNRGQVVEQGNHTELYALQGSYYQLWQSYLPTPSSLPQP